MPTGKTCPKCNEQHLHRSRSRNIIEKTIKFLFHYRTYRCHHCEWRGWIKQKRMGNNKQKFKNFILYSLVFLVSVMIALILGKFILR